MRLKQIVLTLSLFIHFTSAQAKFEAHEWGTFTSLVGSNGVTQNGMYHEDEVLPSFVHPFGATQPVAIAPPTPRPLPTPPFPQDNCRNRKVCLDDEVLLSNSVTQKMETPVIYFYSDQQRRVSVNVKFPKGVITETFPAPTRTFPGLDTKVLQGGDTTFEVDVLNTQNGNIPFVDSHNIYSHARNVNSNIVRTNTEQEKFIFYRGLGQFQPQIQIQSSFGGLRLRANSIQSIPQALFLVNVDANGNSRGVEGPALMPLYTAVIGQHTIEGLKDPSRNDFLSASQLREKLIQSLVKAGLHQDEAVAMLDTWENGYLKTPGLRLLYILPRAEVDQILPITMSPAPEKLERVFVARIEILLDTEEISTLNSIREQKENFDIQTLGRFAEPKLRRVKELAKGDERVPDPFGVLQIIDDLIRRAFSGETSAGGAVE